MAKLLSLSLEELLSLCNLLDKLQQLQGSIAFETYVPLDEKKPDLQSQAILSRVANYPQKTSNGPLAGGMEGTLFTQLNLTRSVASKNYTAYVQPLILIHISICAPILIVRAH
ncbi:MAG: hypothetical protein HC877_02320 [Thioploca sp.]|nr:hypothetical protein [Thioploca sp.]